LRRRFEGQGIYCQLQEDIVKYYKYFAKKDLTMIYAFGTISKAGRQAGRQAGIEFAQVKTVSLITP